jgi:hypothetical protein
MFLHSLECTKDSVLVVFFGKVADRPPNILRFFPFASWPDAFQISKDVHHAPFVNLNESWQPHFLCKQKQNPSARAHLLQPSASTSSTSPRCRPPPPLSRPVLSLMLHMYPERCGSKLTRILDSSQLIGFEVTADWSRRQLMSLPTPKSLKILPKKAPSKGNTKTKFSRTLLRLFRRMALSSSSISTTAALDMTSAKNLPSAVVLVASYVHQSW